jgi:hypothetical protein
LTEEKKVIIIYIDKKDAPDFARLKEKDSPFATCQNKEIFLAAMIIGYHEGGRIALKNRDGYFREEYLVDEERALIRAIAISEVADLNVLLDEQKIYSIAEEYATGGVALLKARVFSGEYGSYAKKLESELLRAFAKIEKKLPKPQTLEEIIKTPLGDLINNGESESVEFKASLIWDFQREQPRKLMGIAAAKVISSFMNSGGGVLLIGVGDDKSVLGLSHDLSQLKGSLDNFELHLTNVINTCLGKINRTYVDIRFEKVEDKDVAIVQVKKARHPVYLQSEGKPEFYIRSGNSSQPLDIDEATLYIKDNWPSLR